MAITEDTLTGMEAALDARMSAVVEYDAYYRGEQRLAFATAKFREAFGTLLKSLADNWCQLVVDASVERLKIEGFRFGPAGDGADEDAWGMWQANYLDADSALAHTEASKSGICYVMVLPGREPSTPRITVEHPAQVITLAAPDDRRNRLAALKRWVEDDGTYQARVYTPDMFYALHRAKNVKRWSQDSAIPNPVGVVPCVPMLNLPGILVSAMSDLAAVISLQDAINKLLADMIVNSEFQAYRQRWATGLDIPNDPATGRPVTREQFLASDSRLWVAEDKDAKFGELAGSDGLGYVRQMEALVQHIAAQTRTPPHYLLGSSGSFPSGESLKATETGLVAKVKRKQITYGETWEEAMRLAFAYRDDPLRAGAMDAEVIWADPESRSEGELVDALLKMRQLGVPLEALWKRWGVSPQEISRWQELLGIDPAHDPANPITDPPAPVAPLALPPAPPTPDPSMNGG